MRQELQFFVEENKSKSGKRRKEFWWKPFMLSCTSEFYQFRLLWAQLKNCWHQLMLDRFFALLLILIACYHQRSSLQCIFKGWGKNIHMGTRKRLEQQWYFWSIIRKKLYILDCRSGRNDVSCFSTLLSITLKKDYLWPLKISFGIGIVIFRFKFH